jgi:hypothetical protein
MIFIWSSRPLFITNLIKIGQLVGLGSKVHGSKFMVNRLANFSDLPVRWTQTGATDFTG